MRVERCAMTLAWSWSARNSLDPANCHTRKTARTSQRYHRRFSPSCRRTSRHLIAFFQAISVHVHCKPSLRRSACRCQQFWIKRCDCGDTELRPRLGLIPCGIKSLKHTKFFAATHICPRPLSQRRRAHTAYEPTLPRSISAVTTLHDLRISSQ